MLVRLYQSRECQEVHLHHFHMISLMFSRLVDGIGGIARARWEHMGWIIVTCKTCRSRGGRTTYQIPSGWPKWPPKLCNYGVSCTWLRLTSYCGQCDAEKKELITDGPEMAGRDCVTRVDRLRKWQNPDPDNRLRPRPRPRP